MGKKKEEPLSGKQLLEDSKQEVKNKVKKQKENKEMKNITNSSKVRTILTVIITLVTVAAFIGTFLAGMNYQKSINGEVASKVEAQARSLESMILKAPVAQQ